MNDKSPNITNRQRIEMALVADIGELVDETNALALLAIGVGAGDKSPICQNDIWGYAEDIDRILGQMRQKCECLTNDDDRQDG